jgi:Cu(I)/Ag(I) efflux system membrane fusion protein
VRRLAGVALLAVGLTAGAAGGYWYARPPAGGPASAVVPETTAAAAERKILYYRDPSGAPNWSAEPKKDAAGRDYLPVFEDEEISFEPKAPVARACREGWRMALRACPPGDGRHSV